jgi:hypothetical protein
MAGEHDRWHWAYSPVGRRHDSEALRNDGKRVAGAALRNVAVVGCHGIWGTAWEAFAVDELEVCRPRGCPVGEVAQGSCAALELVGVEEPAAAHEVVDGLE